MNTIQKLRSHGIYKMRVAVLCEYSGTVRDAFIKLGHDAVSCDTLPTESPGPHIHGDLFDYDWSGYDLVIAHPPCTWIALCGNKHYAGTLERIAAADFIWGIWKLPVEKLAIENPKGQINRYLPGMPKPQYIQPWMFGHGEQKATGLWKRNLPDLTPTDIVPGREQRIWKMPPSKDRGKLRSKFYSGIGAAMAAQWGGKEQGEIMPALHIEVHKARVERLKESYRQDQAFANAAIVKLEKQKAEIEFAVFQVEEAERKEKTRYDRELFKIHRREE